MDETWGRAYLVFRIWCLVFGVWGLEEGAPAAADVREQLPQGATKKVFSVKF
jgi:hypothetical protein